MTSRGRKEEWISTYSEQAFDEALAAVASRQRGLSFFTDEQIEAIVSEMVRKARWHQSFRARQRQTFRTRAA